MVGRHPQGAPLLVVKPIKAGGVIYAGTHFGPVLDEPASPVAAFLLSRILGRVKAVGGMESHGVRAHLDELKTDQGKVLHVVVSQDRGTLEANWESACSVRGVFSRMVLPSRDGRVSLRTSAPFADLFVAD